MSRVTTERAAIVVIGAAAAAVIAVASGTYTGVDDAIWMAESDQANAHLGETVAAAGDVNGDGWADVIVGSRDYDDAFTDQGMAWVYYGGPGGLSAAPDVTLHSPQPHLYGFFAEEATSAGDVNGDGYDDVMVSMTNYDASYPDEGAVFVYHGGPAGLDPTHDWYARGNATYAHLGWGAGPAGDVNGDGYDDIIVGGYRYDEMGFTSVHDAYVFHGSPSGLDNGGARPVGLRANADWIAEGDQDKDAFGLRVGCAGDVNGDGYDDVFVGAPRYDGTYADEGAVFVWHGSAAGLGPAGSPSNADWSGHSGQPNSYLGGYWELPICDIAKAGDVNGDGFDDLIVGAPRYDAADTDDGIAMVWYGSATGLGDDGSPANADWIAAGQYEGDNLGGQVASAGDFNGDGFDDVLIGSFGHDLIPAGATNDGMALIWFGGEHGLLAPGLPFYSDVMIEGDQSGDYFGLTLAGVGDVNGDGLDDVAVGAYNYDHGQENEGVVFGFAGQNIVFIDDFDTGDPERWSRIGP